MKCSVCNKVKGKRLCLMDSKYICSKCCGEHRNIIDCSSFCEHMPKEGYHLIENGSLELTEVGRGKVILFSENLFLPNAFDCFYANIKTIEINIKNPILVSIYMKFSIKSDIKRRVDKSEIYYLDEWKRIRDRLIPFIQIYTIGSGNIYNEKLMINDLTIDILIENNHLDTWLPGSKVITEKIDRNEKMVNDCPPDMDTAPVCYGKHFFGKNSTFFADIDLDKEYILSFDIEYDSIHTVDKDVYLPLGLFIPFKMVNYDYYKINLLNKYSFNKNAEVQLMLPYSDKVISSFCIPLEGNNKLSSPQSVKYNVGEMGVDFHYDRYAILYHGFFLDTEKKSIANAVFTKLPIFTGLYDTFNKVYDGEYAPVNITILNNNDDIVKYNVEVEILGLSHKKVKEIYVDPHKIKNEKIVPQLIDEKINLITSNCGKDIYVRVTENGETIYENTDHCLVYPKETFIEKLDNNRNDFRIDFRSFLARWVTPNAPEIDTIISKATGEGSVLGGTTTNSFRSESDIKKIYDVLSKMKYSIRVLSFSEGSYHTQRISLPQNTVRLNSGNCIDLSVLLASCFEAIKLNAYIMLIPGHAFVRVKLPDESNICIESTCLGTAEYSYAVKRGTEYYNEYFINTKPEDMDKVFMVDISLARKSKIFPMN